MPSKNLVIVIAAIVVAAILFFSMKSCNGYKQQLDELRTMNKAYRDSTHYWKNKADEEVASRKVVEGSLANMKTFFTKQEMQELEKRFNTKFENLKSLVKISSQGQTTLPPSTKPEVVFVDSSGPCPVVTAMEQAFENQWYKLKVRVGDGAYARLLAYDTTTIVTKRAYTRRFLSKQWFTQVDAISANDSIHNKVEGAFVIKDSYRTKYVAIFGQAGYRYWQGGTNQNIVAAGAGVSYDIGRLNAAVSYNHVLSGGGNYFIEGTVRFSVLRL